MSAQQKEGKKLEKVVVAVKASKDIPKAALVWALTHVVQPGDCISLIVVVPPQTSGWRLWGFPRFAGDCASAHKRSQTGTSSEHKLEISDTCSQMILQLHNVYDPSKISVNVKIVSTSPSGAVAAEAKNVQASWVVLDKDLKNEEKHCMDELHCNIVGMRRAHPKVLRLSLAGSPTKELEAADLAHSEGDNFGSKENSSCSIRGPTVTPSSSPEMFTATEAGTSSVSSSDPSTSPFSISDVNLVSKKDEAVPIRRSRESCSETDSKSSMPCPTSSGLRPWMDKYLRSNKQYLKGLEKSSNKINDQERTPSTRWLLEKLSTLDQEAESGSESYLSELEFAGNVREAISLSRSPLPGPPPLCTICQHKAPIFGKPPRWFGYAELELATGGFSHSNFLAEGGYGSVHRGVLSDGQVIAVKQHKLASSQGDVEFCSEVEVLSCAQHRNVVMLIGYCIEDKRRLLVYEYICNGSLDSHLYGRIRDPLEWHARQKIAVGAARGLRYLHEECRVGCIVHRDMRPNNILLTHDYEPLVGDFGLARWQPDGDTGEQTRVIGTFGYLAPEYAQSGQITEKADVYSFGVVLVEMLTGRKAVDLSRPKGQQCLTEWARPLLEEYAINELIDPRLGNRFSEQEVHYMMHAASACIRRDPHSRPRMSQVLRILEGDTFMDSDYMSTPGYNGSRSGRLRADYEQHQSYSGPLLKEGSESEVFKGSFSFDSVRAALWSRD